MEGPLAEESEHEVEAVGEEGGLVDGEVEEGAVPSGARPAAVVDGGGIPSVGVDEGVAGNGDDGIDLHLQDESDVLEVLRRKVSYVKRSAEIFHVR